MITLPTIKTDTSHRSQNGAKCREPKVPTGQRLLTVTQNMSFSAQDCLSRPSAQWPVHNFSATLDIPD